MVAVGGHFQHLHVKALMSFHATYPFSRTCMHLSYSFLIGKAFRIHHKSPPSESSNVMHLKPSPGNCVRVDNSKSWFDEIKLTPSLGSSSADLLQRANGAAIPFGGGCDSITSWHIDLAAAKNIEAVQELYRKEACQIWEALYRLDAIDSAWLNDISIWKPLSILYSIRKM